ncbi:uncharacterized protein N7515_007565 [Penicillium bovifimosum]|uniref:Uncharacterized protein n=1 Tax=Penicillium bovifimosum TaxID=126998 RepID=A0A9W9L1S5_9EURO|nr:uncharacterized protein N7515_007565 [Penicillium bovifimosum]KAJ5131526.1 hypothetical protein N7515_007565 [Penicillium bovifimosum]
MLVFMESPATGPRCLSHQSQLLNKPPVLISQEAAGLSRLKSQSHLLHITVTSDYDMDTDRHTYRGVSPPATSADAGIDTDEEDGGQG